MLDGGVLGRIYVPIKESSGWELPVQGSSSRPLKLTDP